MTAQGKIKHTARTARGKVKEIVGRAVGNKRMVRRGKTERVTARIRHTAENNHMTMRAKLSKASARISEKLNK